MKTYRGVVVFRYYQEVTVEAEDEESARWAMFEEFNRHKADGESEICDFEELKESGDA